MCVGIETVDNDSTILQVPAGDFEVISLRDGDIERPLGDGIVRNATLDEVKSALRSAGLSDATLFTAVAVKRNDNLLLIDSGSGGFPIYGPGDCYRACRLRG